MRPDKTNRTTGKIIKYFFDIKFWQKNYREFFCLSDLHFQVAS
jgi:hypothetical protein